MTDSTAVQDRGPSLSTGPNFVPNGLLSSGFVPNGLLGRLPSDIEETSISEASQDVTLSETSTLLMVHPQDLFLLGSNKPLPSRLLTTDVPMQDNTDSVTPSSCNGLRSLSFIPNGLLGDGDSQRMDVTPSEPSTLFVAPVQDSSLLGSNKLLVASSLLATDVPMQDSTDSVTPSYNGFMSLSFTPNGLLGEGNSQSMDTGNNYSDTQDGNFPNPSQLLAPFLKDSPLARSPTSGQPFPQVPIKAVDFDGKSVYLPRKRKNTPHTPTITERPTNMLEVPIHRLMESMSTVEAARLAARDRNAATSHNHNNDSKTPPEGKLWVDRYRPQRFLDLVGDERVHRETLAWVKEWDYCVFRKRRPKGKQHTEGEENYEDEHHRPRERILLLSGPPGLGKTTLAHVVAKQAGYQVMEINASDARSGHVVDERIKPALETGSAVGSKKPTLLVVDEIDGATGGGDNTVGFVQKLLQLILHKPKRKGQSKEHKARPLLRPIIAICNDLYASSLAKLRQHARIIRFNRPPDVRLVKRLREICEIEGLRADSRALTALVGVARGDMRGCLNTLQFIKSKDQDVTESVVRSATVGMNEADASLTSVLNDLFFPLSKRRVRELGLTEAQEARYVSRLSRDLEASGSIDRVSLGCFEHYPNLHVHDATFQRYEDALEWLSTFDKLAGTMRSEREYALLPYLAYTLVPFFPLFSQRDGPRVERPKMDWENFTLTKTNEEICNAITKPKPLPGSAINLLDYRYLTMGPVLKLELLPMLNRIIAPPLRPVNSQLVKPEEKALLKRLVDIMVALELRFIQEKKEDGSLVYRLDPPIDVFITYDGKKAPDVPISRYAVRRMIAGEIDATLIARQVDAIDKGSGTKYEFFRHKRKEATEVTNTTTIPQKRKLDDIHIDPAEKPPTDFFGRLIPITVQADAPNATAAPPAKFFKVVYRFKEGNSAAVRKGVKVETLLR